MMALIDHSLCLLSRYSENSSGLVIMRSMVLRILICPEPNSTRYSPILPPTFSSILISVMADGLFLSASTLQALYLSFSIGATVWGQLLAMLGSLLNMVAPREPCFKVSSLIWMTSAGSLTATGLFPRLRSLSLFSSFSLMRTDLQASSGGLRSFLCLRLILLSMGSLKVGVSGASVVGTVSAWMIWVGVGCSCKLLFIFFLVRLFCFCCFLAGLGGGLLIFSANFLNLASICFTSYMIYIEVLSIAFELRFLSFNCRDFWLPLISIKSGSASFCERSKGDQVPICCVLTSLGSLWSTVSSLNQHSASFPSLSSQHDASSIDLSSASFISPSAGSSTLAPSVGWGSSWFQKFRTMSRTDERLSAVSQVASASWKPCHLTRYSALPLTTRLASSRSTSQYSSAIGFCIGFPLRIGQ